MPPSPQSKPHRIVRSDGENDQLTNQRFDNYDAAYDALELYYRDFCCSDDDRVDYSIQAQTI